MPDDPIVVLIKRSRQFVLDAFKEDELADFLFTDFEQFDYHGEKEGDSFQGRVFALIMKLKRRGETVLVARFADAAARYRHQRPDANDLIALATPFLPAVAGAPPPPPPPLPPPGPAPAAAQPLVPTELAALFTLYSEQPGDMSRLAGDLRVKLRGKSYRAERLPRRLHGSDRVGDRLLALLALEAEPEAVYLRWQAEQVAADPPLVGFAAAQSLIAAALRLDLDELPWVRLAATVAADRLAGLDGPAAVAAPTPSVRMREIEAARALCDIRGGQMDGVMTHDDMELCLREMAATFNADRLRSLSSNWLKSAFRMLNRPSDPPERFVAKLITSARESDTEPDLIQANYEELPGSVAFKNLHTKYVVDRHIAV